MKNGVISVTEFPQCDRGQDHFPLTYCSEDRFTGATSPGGLPLPMPSEQALPYPFLNSPGLADLPGPETPGQVVPPFLDGPSIFSQNNLLGSLHRTSTWPSTSSSRLWGPFDPIPPQQRSPPRLFPTCPPGPLELPILLLYFFVIHSSSP